MAVNSDRPSLKPRNVARAVRRLRQLGLAYVTPQLEADVLDFLRYAQKHMGKHIHKYSPQNLAEMSVALGGLCDDPKVHHIAKQGNLWVRPSLGCQTSQRHGHVIGMQLRES